ncbi:hypothetical protein TGRUB_433910, partial [Toxoplasma gondii RUB]
LWCHQTQHVDRSCQSDVGPGGASVSQMKHGRPARTAPPPPANYTSSRSPHQQ